MYDRLDEPIYLLALPSMDSVHTNPTMYWFVIEDNRNNTIIHHQKHYQSLNPNRNHYEHDYHYQMKEGEVEVVSLSHNNTDIFRSLSLPSLSHRIHFTNIVLINSRIYMLGGHDLFFDDENRGHILPKHNIVRFCDIFHPHNPPWQIGPSFPSPQSFMEVATARNGSIVVIGTNSSDKKRALWLECLTSTWRVLPKPPKKLKVFSNTVKLLALTDTHIFCTFYSKTKPFTYGLRFSLVNKKWEVFDKRSFNGIWSKGIVLYDSYLVLFGSNNCDSVLNIRGLLCVYDLKECRWVLMDSHAGGIYRNAFPPYCSNYLLRPNTLFQVAVNKFAFIWQDKAYVFPTVPLSEPPESHFHIYCTKIILHLTSSTNLPHTPRKKKKKTTGTKLHFEVVSHGIYRVGRPMIDSTVG